jgi:hypothetical protein
MLWFAYQTKAKIIYENVKQHPSFSSLAAEEVLVH